jgi:transcriptional regulator with XRE-family HTH domain
MHEQLARTIGNALRTARIRLELTQQDVAEAIDINVLIYGRMERGKLLPSVPTLCKLCVVLQASSDELLGFTPPGLRPGPTTHEPH